VSLPKTAEPIEMLFGLWARRGPRNRALDESPEVLRDVAMTTNFGTNIALTGFVRMIATRQMERGLSGRPTDCRYCRYLSPKVRRCHGNQFLAFCIWGAHWCHLANTTEPSVRCGDAALCQITLTTCCVLCVHDRVSVVSALLLCMVVAFKLTTIMQITAGNQ